MRFCLASVAAAYKAALRAESGLDGVSPHRDKGRVSLPPKSVFIRVYPWLKLLGTAAAVCHELPDKPWRRSGGGSDGGMIFLKATA
jgi:hypothetical protein